MMTQTRKTNITRNPIIRTIKGIHTFYESLELDESKNRSMKSNLQFLKLVIKEFTYKKTKKVDKGEISGVNVYKTPQTSTRCRTTTRKEIYKKKINSK